MNLVYCIVVIGVAYLMISQFYYPIIKEGIEEEKEKKEKKLLEKSSKSISLPKNCKIDNTNYNQIKEVEKIIEEIRAMGIKINEKNIHDINSEILL
jgi:3-phosphoglycerate kinase